MLRPVLVYTLLGYCIYIGIKIYVFTGDISFTNPLQLWIIAMCMTLAFTEVLIQKQIEDDGA